jgi:hypothetical protein
MRLILSQYWICRSLGQQRVLDVFRDERLPFNVEKLDDDDVKEVEDDVEKMEEEKEMKSAWRNKSRDIPSLAMKERRCGASSFQIPQNRILVS